MPSARQRAPDLPFPRLLTISAHLHLHCPCPSHLLLPRPLLKLPSLTHRLAKAYTAPEPLPESLVLAAVHTTAGRAPPEAAAGARGSDGAQAPAAAAAPVAGDSRGGGDGNGDRRFPPLPPPAPELLQRAGAPAPATQLPQLPPTRAGSDNGSGSPATAGSDGRPAMPVTPSVTGLRGQQRTESWQPGKRGGVKRGVASPLGTAATAPRQGRGCGQGGGGGAYRDLFDAWVSWEPWRVQHALLCVHPGNASDHVAASTCHQAAAWLPDCSPA